MKINFWEIFKIFLKFGQKSDENMKTNQFEMTIADNNA